METKRESEGHSRPGEGGELDKLEYGNKASGEGHPLSGEDKGERQVKTWKGR
jgi:hypothetical protein